MKMRNKYFMLLTFVSALFFTACEDEITREASPVTNPNSTNVFFSKANSSSPVLGIDAASFDVKIGRSKTEKEQTVSFTAENVYTEIFEIPSSVTFAAGEAEKNITIKVKNMELMKSYHLALVIDKEQTKPYVTQDVFPRIELNVLKEDFAPYAKGTYSNVFFASGDDYESSEKTLEYSPSTSVYRLKNCWTEGYNVKFKWDGSATVNMVGSTNGSYVVIETGSVHSKYGMISAYYKGCSYDAASKKFTFPITWRVSAGSFGAYPDYFTITQKL